ncbi:MAG: FtsQ-type POTRA domain-containing protein [Candidatus Eisenbacteria bacterium]
MGWYQGRALEPLSRRARRPAPLPRRIAQVGGVLALIVLLAHVPWQGLRSRLARVTDVHVEGAHYLDAARVMQVAGLAPGQDLFALDLARARQALLLDPRVASAEVRRRLPRGVRVRIVERQPVLLVNHGVPWEIDSAGVLLPPLQPGVVADVPLLVGPRFAGLPAGMQVDRPEVRRGLAWVRALSARELQLAGQVSEVDVSDPSLTGLTLLDGTRVLAPGWPPGTSRLSALRVVLADLKARGTTAGEVDLRYENQVIVRPVVTAEGAHSG